MTTAKEQKMIIEGELTRIRSEIDKLKAQEEVLLKILAQANGEPGPSAPRKRSPSIKPLVLDIMARAGFTGATTAEVDKEVREKVPSVAKDTVGSILSRLKSDGALTYDGERYYEKRFAPDPPQGGSLRAVS
jgi:hypothetical protein